MSVTAILAAATTLAPLLGAAPWANAPAPPPLDHRVAVVDVFTFGCINCKHVTPELQRLRAEYPAETLAIVGVHAPETPYERDHANVTHALAEQHITWPVVFDDGFRIWNAYGVSAWPTQLVFDKHGKLRATYVGEGYDAQVARIVKELVAER